MSTSLLHHLLDQQADRAPHARALSRAGHSWDYVELRRRSLAAAGWLRRYRVNRGDRILILDRNNLETLALVFGASRIGACYVIIRDQTQPYQLRHILADCSPRLVIGSGTAVTRLPGTAGVPCVDFAAVTDTAPADRARDEQAAGAPPVLSTDPVSLIYTSGSTALPKAVVSTHQQVLAAVHAIHSRLQYRDDDVVLCGLPLSFDYGLYQTFLACVGGSAVVLGSDEDAGPGLLRCLVRARISVLPLVPSLAVTLCRLLDRHARQHAGSGPEHPLARLRMVTNTGAALSPALAARLRALIPGVAVVAMFGLTECKRVSIAEPDLDLVRPGSVGRPLPGTEVFAVGPDGRRLAAGEVGELVVRGPHVMAGYWNAPELTATRFRRDYLGRTTLHTGDYGYLDSDGYLYFVTRRDEIYKQNGFRVSTTEVEAAAMDIAGVELAVVLPPDGRHGARLAVSGTISSRQLIKELRARLEAPKVPAECRIFDTLPLNGNGKVERRAVRQLWEQPGQVDPV
jgi:acyl-CoA synthetase (AMP-forming)/AMP-acid ligase II